MYDCCSVIWSHSCTFYSINFSFLFILYSSCSLSRNLSRISLKQNWTNHNTTIPVSFFHFPVQSLLGENREKGDFTAVCDPQHVGWLQYCVCWLNLLTLFGLLLCNDNCHWNATHASILNLDVNIGFKHLICFLFSTKLCCTTLIQIMVILSSFWRLTHYCVCSGVIGSV